ncbi:fucose permease [Sphaerochaeta pleomorpha str. Grapes]|uniref:Fucose permease n=1 Tax=Sphaerochaeta pleomorpha (strain ATCC BAA-1885 / DSM 22778 / Grapes) TaxID=158190 RepID=G8QSI0_SPHPG|nr:MFS transporter [Sphaerochaeta pleomorpha]AEV27879.1 fucose permease [Sphaerochaeta pleomorpha str. Grapes]
MNYNRTIHACYEGNLVGALACNLTPLLFVTLMTDYGLTFEMAGRLTLINFFTQIVTDLAFSRPVDKYGPRRFVVAGHFIAAIGLALFALSPRLFPSSPYVGFVIATIIFSCASGLMELLLSPIIQAIPGPEKAKAMALLHSFYAWGFILVVVLTTFLLTVLQWQWVMLLWTIVPLAGGINFCFVPLAPMVAEHERTKGKELLASPLFFLLVLGILAGGAAEVSMSQWTSAFTEQALHLPKATGDLIGLCLFAACLGTGRALFGHFGSKWNVRRLMTIGSSLAVVCYLVAALSPIPLVSLFACSACGFATSLLWPGSIVLSTRVFPLAGAGMFALLAAAGDTGAAIGPYLIGLVADHAPVMQLKAGLIAGSLFPFILIFLLLGQKRMEKNELSS